MRVFLASARARAERALRAIPGGFLAAALVLVGSPAPAFAQSDRASAEALFRAGRQAMDQGDYAKACARFAESNRLDPAVGTAFNLGACNEKLGRLAEAWQYFREVAERVPAGDTRAAISRQHADALEAILGHLTISLSGGAPEGAVVVKDGVELGAGSLGVELPVNPGEHTLELRAPGRMSRSVRVTLERGEHREIQLEPGPPVAGAEVDATRTSVAPAKPRAPEGEPSASGRTLGYVLVGVGAVGLVTTLVAGAEVLARKGTVEDHCVGNRCDPVGYDAGQSGKIWSTVGTVSFVAGAASLGGGIILLTTSGGSDHGEGHAEVSGAIGTFRGAF